MKECWTWAGRLCTCLSESMWQRVRGQGSRMIAAQLLAYYFTELKDDQVKKVSLVCHHLCDPSLFACDSRCAQRSSGLLLLSRSQLFSAVAWRRGAGLSSPSEVTEAGLAGLLSLSWHSNIDSVLSHVGKWDVTSGTGSVLSCVGRRDTCVWLIMMQVLSGVKKRKG